MTVKKVFVKDLKLALLTQQRILTQERIKTEVLKQQLLNELIFNARNKKP